MKSSVNGNTLKTIPFVPKKLSKNTFFEGWSMRKLIGFLPQISDFPENSRNFRTVGTKWCRRYPPMLEYDQKAPSLSVSEPSWTILKICAKNMWARRNRGRGVWSFSGHKNHIIVRNSYFKQLFLPRTNIQKIARELFFKDTFGNLKPAQ